VSELLRRIDQAMISASDDLQRAELMARRAAYLARVGPLDEASRIIDDLRQTARVPGFERLGIWVILCDGILDHYTNPSDRAQDRIMRAQRLSLAFGDSRLIPITSAWRAFIEFDRGNMEEMVEAAEIAISSSIPTEPESRARVATTLSYAFNCAGDSDEARAWFKTAHHHAVLSGDQATIEALIYNSASFDLANLRVAFCTRQLEDSEVSANALQITSARSFHKLIRAESLERLNDLCAARHLMLAEKFDEAASALQALETKGPFSRLNFSQDMLFLEISYCFAKSGQLGLASSWLERVYDREMVILDPDDRMFAAKLLLELSKLGLGFEAECAAAARLSARIADFELFTSRLSTALERLRGRHWPVVSST